MTTILPGSGQNAEINLNNKWRIYYNATTNEWGPQIRLTNKTGSNTTKGYLCKMSSTQADAINYVQLGEPDIIGVVYEAGVADGSECWVWTTNAVCQVYYVGSVDLEDFARMGVAADGGSAGQGVAEVAPTSPFSTDKHFQEIGHVVEARVGAGLARTLLHFN